MISLLPKFLAVSLVLNVHSSIGAISLVTTRLGSARFLSFSIRWQDLEPGTVLGPSHGVPSGSGGGAHNGK